MTEERDAEDRVVSGNCLCGAVRWQTTTAYTHMSHCHCSMCRKAHAAPFATYAGTAQAGFSWLAGEEAIERYGSSQGYLRSFCRHCGSALPVHDPDGQVYVPGGLMNEDPGIRPSKHIFAGSKAPWYEIADDLPQHAAYPPELDAPVIARPDPGPATPGVLRGSCLCGDVAFEVRAPFQAVHNCHCSRCRKARAAAHTTNGFTAVEDVVFLRGEDLLVTYELPGAKYFTHVFCRRCGSGMPRLSAERGIAVIPLAALDDDPGRGAQDHIFVGSKAPWYEIADDLPRFEEAPG